MWASHEQQWYSTEVLSTCTANFPNLGVYSCWDTWSESLDGLEASSIPFINQWWCCCCCFVRSPYYVCARPPACIPIQLPLQDIWVRFFISLLQRLLYCFSIMPSTCTTPTNCTCTFTSLHQYSTAIYTDEVAPRWFIDIPTLFWKCLSRYTN